MPQADEWTNGRLLEWTTAYLKDHQAGTPRLDAEVLLAEARGCQRIELYTAFDEIASEPTRTAFRELVRRRAEGTPVAYLVGRREFYSLDFHVTPDVLIPRPETEFVMIQLLDRAKGLGDQPLDIVDMGTGSGILAICAACHLPHANVFAVDSSANALDVAAKNAKRHGVADRIRFIKSDLFHNLPEQQFHLIVSNPPYVSDDEWLQLPDEIRTHEPKEAFVAGPEGTDVIARLIPQAVQRLRSGGWLIFEISPMIEAAARRLLQSESKLAATSVIKDLAKLPRVVESQRTD